MNSYMLHHVNNGVLDKLNSIVNNDDIITFDDGLYSVYKFRDRLTPFSNKKIIYITPMLVNFTHDYILCKPKDAMFKHFMHNDNSPFMSIDDIKTLLDMGYLLGAHGFTHDVILHGFSNKKLKINEWRFYKYPHIKDSNKPYYNIDSCLSCAGYEYINGNFSRFSDSNYHSRINDEISMMLEWFYKNLYIPDTFAFPFNSFNDIVYEKLCREFKHIYLDDRLDICEYIDTYY